MSEEIHNMIPRECMSITLKRQLEWVRKCRDSKEIFYGMYIIFSGLQCHGGRQGEDGKRRWLLLQFTFDDNNYIFPWASSESTDNQETISTEYFFF